MEPGGVQGRMPSQPRFVAVLSHDVRPSLQITGSVAAKLG